MKYTFTKLGYPIWSSFFAVWANVWNKALQANNTVQVFFPMMPFVDNWYNLPGWKTTKLVGNKGHKM